MGLPPPEVARHLDITVQDPTLVYTFMLLEPGERPVEPQHGVVGCRDDVVVDDPVDAIGLEHDAGRSRRGQARQGLILQAGFLRA